MGGGNPLKRAEKEVKRSSKKVEAEVSRFNDKYIEPVLQDIGSLFSFSSSSPAPAPAPEPEPEPVITEEIDPDELTLKRKAQELRGLGGSGGYSNVGYSSNEGRIRVRETVSGVGKSSSSKGTSGLGY